MPLISHSRLTEKCHHRASPRVWRRPGMPSQVGRVTESSLAVQIATLRHRNLKAKPIGSRRAVSAPIEPRMIRQDLHACAHDEQHEEHVQEVLKLQPPWKARVDRGRRLGDARDAA